MKHLIGNAILLTAFATTAIGCQDLGQNSNDGVRSSAVPAQGEADDLSDETGSYTGFMTWSDADNPALLDADSSYEYKLAALPSEGKATVTPWAGSYWPTHLDSINFRWDGSIKDVPGDSSSPSEKFAKAFDRPDLVENVSKEYGILSRPTACTTHDECKDEGLCAKRPGETEGRCVETWFGICHAWAPAAIMIPEPKRPVTYNGVTFKVNDIKALVSLGFTKHLSTKMLSERCYDKLDDVTFDEYGRPTKPGCVDTNPGTFHVVVTNMLGIQGKSFVEDKTIDYEVWNQPVRSFKVLRNTVVDAKTANAMLDAEGNTYLFNDKAVTLHHLRTSLSYISEPPVNVDGNLSGSIDQLTSTDVYDYILELDAEGRIIGGEWIGDSKKNHPDFLWVPEVKQWTEFAKGSKAGSGIKWHEVMYLVEQSTKEESGTTTGGFDWGSACDAGNGTFSQPIKQKDIVVVGTIPAGKANVRVDLVSPEDVDIQLIDAQTGYAIVAWPNGQYAGHSLKEDIIYEGMTIAYSGYNGVNGKLGHEFIEITGETTRPLIMKAYGYKAGQADISYSFKAPEGCVDTGDGAFEQDIHYLDVVNVGRIPAGKKNIRIELKSSVDVDIQLYDGPVALIKWPDGKLNGYGKQTLEYQGMTLTWSGYNGDGTGLGNEYITISGEVPSDLTMRAFGYKAGEADVKYAWGLDADALDKKL